MATPINLYTATYEIPKKNISRTLGIKGKKNRIKDIKGSFTSEDLKIIPNIPCSTCTPL